MIRPVCVIGPLESRTFVDRLRFRTDDGCLSVVLIRKRSLVAMSSLEGVWEVDMIDANMNSREET